MYRKSLTINEIGNKREHFKKQIVDLDSLENKTKQILKIEPASIDELIAYKYIEIQHLNDVSEWLNASGYRVKTDSKIKGERKYNTNDVADAIENNRKENSLFQLAFAYFQYNKQKTDITPLIKLINMDDDQ